MQFYRLYFINFILCFRARWIIYTSINYLYDLAVGNNTMHLHKVAKLYPCSFQSQRQYLHLHLSVEWTICILQSASKWWSCEITRKFSFYSPCKLMCLFVSVWVMECPFTTCSTHDWSSKESKEYKKSYCNIEKYFLLQLLYII
jgi:hypothetical protein